MIPVLDLAKPANRTRLDELLTRLRLDVRSLLLDGGELFEKTASVRAMLVDVATRGDAAVIDLIRKFDDSKFESKRLRATKDDMAAAADRVRGPRLDAIRKSIEQVREYQRRIRPVDVRFLSRPGVELGLRYTPLDSAGIYAPGGKASYPSSLIMLATPAVVAGVKRIVVCSPANPAGDNDLVLAVAHELGLEEFYRIGGVAAFAAMACGTETIKPVDKLLGPGNSYTQLAKRLLFGAVGVDGFLGPSDILVVADHSCEPKYVAADLLAQAEHDPGSCFLVTRSCDVAEVVAEEIERQMKSLKRADAIQRSFSRESAIIVCESDDQLYEIADRIAAEHVNIQTSDPDETLSRLTHGGAFFLGANSPVAAGDYVAGPSHCLPTNSTARFSAGVSVFEFMKRSSVVHYEAKGLTADTEAITTLAEAEGLDAHAASVRVRNELAADERR